jgi:hypothetical protein
MLGHLGTADVGSPPNSIFGPCFGNKLRTQLKGWEFRKDALIAHTHYQSTPIYFGRSPYIKIELRAPSRHAFLVQYTGG